ncbi:MAG: DUF1549 domain-containing protein [Gemmatales bacterium]
MWKTLNQFLLDASPQVAENTSLLYFSPDNMRFVISILMAALFGAAQAQESVFRRDVVPILQSKCLRCHSGSDPKGDLNLSSAASTKEGGVSGRIVVPMKAIESLLYKMVKSHKMPPKEKLSDDEIEAIRKWIDAGAVWDGPELKAGLPSISQRAGLDWWSLQPIRRPSMPPISSPWVRNPIDHFILDRLTKMGLKPAIEADRRTFLRRVTFDLIGLPPSPSDIDDFLKDTSIDAYEKVVDRLLASPRYGERWGRHWLDVVRFAESHGYETNELRRNAWPYRDWVIRAFNEDKSFDRFVMEQLAGDVVAKGDASNEVATGFMVGGTHDVVGNQTPEGMAQQRQDDLYDMVSTTGSAFLGLTVNCARCHDHKFDPITQRDYYGLQAIFAGTQHGTRMIANPDKQKELKTLETSRNKLVEKIVAIESATSELGSPRAKVNTEVFSPVNARYVRFTVQSTALNDEPCIDELEIYSASEKALNIALASHGGRATASSAYPDSTIHKIEHLNDGQVGNSHSWISNEKGTGWAQIELAKPVTINRIVWGRDRLMRFSDRLPTKYKIDVSLDGKSWQTVCTQEDRLHRTPTPEVKARRSELPTLEKERASLEKKIEEIRNQSTVYCGSFKPCEKVHLLKRGDPMQKLEEVHPSAIESLRVPLKLNKHAGDAERRQALANWITDLQNPLPPRVMVNRIWHYHFGTGLVGTPSDFGFNGEKPSHPELLDWLAAEFHAQGGREKRLHRMIVLSATYRQSSNADEVSRQTAEKIDAGNRLLWRSPRRRLEAEALHDATLAVSGTLDLRMGGPGYDLWDYSNYVVVFKPRTPLPSDTNRRMVYQFKPRTQQDSVFGAFDCPDGTLTMPRRNSSITPLQALNLLNSQFILNQCKQFAERLRKECPNDVNTQIRQAYVLAYARMPTTNELSLSETLVKSHGLESLCRVLFNSNEFLFVD